MIRSSIPLLVAGLIALPSGARAQEAEQARELGQLSESFEALAERVGRAVVYITASGLRLSPYPDDRGQRAVARLRSAGSGVILDPEGYIVTNGHVVEGATRIRVELAEPAEGLLSGRSVLKPRGQLLEAHLVGLDRETDLAVLKIDRDGAPHLELADSDDLRPGQLVFAFGSPLGLENSVSIGVVSSAARQLRPEDPVIYVQTDAAVNPGNSGGPLVDTDGRVVGINSLIFSQSGGSEGISFAVPSNIVRAVFEQIRDTGWVRRGLIGVKAQTITPNLARGLELERTWGVIISDVYQRSPAAEAGLRIGDIIDSLDGKLMENARQFNVNVYARPAGDTVRIEVLRDSQLFKFPVAVVERPGDIRALADLASVERNVVREFGILAIDLDSELAVALPSVRGSRGVLVAAKAGVEAVEIALAPGDVIYAINNRPVGSVGDLRVAIAGLSVGDPVVLQVEREGELMYLAFEADW